MTIVELSTIIAGGAVTVASVFTIAHSVVAILSIRRVETKKVHPETKEGLSETSIHNITLNEVIYYGRIPDLPDQADSQRSSNDKSTVTAENETEVPESDPRAYGLVLPLFVRSVQDVSQEYNRSRTEIILEHLLGWTEPGDYVRFPLREGQEFSMAIRLRLHTLLKRYTWALRIALLGAFVVIVGMLIGGPSN